MSLSDGVEFGDIATTIAGLLAIGEVKATFNVKGATITVTVKKSNAAFTVI